MPHDGRLTYRERGILDLIVAGLTNKQIGEKLFISSRTVEIHRANLMAKIGARNTADVVRIALKGQYSTL